MTLLLPTGPEARSGARRRSGDRLPVRPRRHDADPSRDARRLLQVFAVLLMVVPSDSVVLAVGAAGFAAGLVGMAGFAAYWACVLLGLHDPRPMRTPVRSCLWLLWAVSLASYASMHLGDQPPEALLAADRWLMLLATTTGVVLLASECLTTPEDVRRVLRALVWGGAVCGVVAGLQFRLSLDLSGALRSLPGFSLGTGAGGISSRGGLNRVAGTAIHPIELGVVAAMLLPLALHLALHDTTRRALRLTPLALIAVAVPASVSRSAILGATTSLGIFLVLQPASRRVVGLALTPVVAAAVFFTTPGLVSTLGSFFGAGTSDPSVATRVDDYPFVEALVRTAPWLGQGGGTFLPKDAFEILDNQYLKTAVELGLLGEVALLLLMAVPVLTALAVRRRTEDPELRTLLAALAGSSAAGALCCLFFDGFSFPMFTCVHALVLGLIGWARVRTPPLPLPTARRVPRGSARPPVRPEGTP